jgi:hypothetical protein
LVKRQRPVPSQYTILMRLAFRPYDRESAMWRNKKAGNMTPL